MTDCPLSRRQLEVVRHAFQGLTQQQTALRMGVAHSTIRSHWNAIFTKTGLPGSGQVFALAVRHGWAVGPDIEVPDFDEVPCPGDAFVVFRDRPASLDVTDAQRVYLQEFDAMLANHRDEDPTRVEAAFVLVAGNRQRPGRNIDGLITRLARTIATRPGIGYQDAPFGDRRHVTDVP